MFGIWVRQDFRLRISNPCVGEVLGGNAGSILGKLVEDVTAVLCDVPVEKVFAEQCAAADDIGVGERYREYLRCLARIRDREKLIVGLGRTLHDYHCRGIYALKDPEGALSCPFSARFERILVWCVTFTGCVLLDAGGLLGYRENTGWSEVDFITPNTVWELKCGTSGNVRGKAKRQVEYTILNCDGYGDRPVRGGIILPRFSEVWIYEQF